MNDLVTVDPAEQQKLAAMLGATQDSGDHLARLKIQTKPVVKADGKKNYDVVGQFTITGEDDPVFAKTVRIRVLSQMFQWQHFDNDEKKLLNKTVMIPNFRQEPIDMKGGVRCGKPASKVFRELDKAEQKKYKDINCVRQLRALVSYAGVTAEGVEVEVENVPVIIQLKGSNFSPFEDEFIKKLPRGKNLYDYWATVSTTEHENGDVTYWVWHYEPDLANFAPLDRDTIDTMYRFADLIEAENKRIREAHEAKVRGRSQDDAASDALGLDGDLVDITPDDDDIPF